MDRAEAWQLLRDTSQLWVDDEGSDVVWAGEFEGRWAVRMAQEVRDFTTVWLTLRQRMLHGRCSSTGSAGRLAPLPC